MAEIDVSWIYEYNSNVELELQKTKSVLEDCVLMETGVRGEGYRPEMRVGKAGYQRRNTRLEPKTAQELTMIGRWVEPEEIDVGPFYEDDLDKLRNSIGLMGTWTKAAAAAFNEAKDDYTLEAMFGSAKTGKNGGGTAATFDDTNQRVAVNYGGGSNTGLTVDKVKGAKAIFMGNNVDVTAEQVYMLITEKEWEDLLDDITFVSGDFSSGRPLQTGEVEEYVGVKFKFMASTDYDAKVDKVSTHRRLPVWVQSGVNLSLWQPPKMDMHIAKQFRGNPAELYGTATLGATRLDEKKVADVLVTA